MMPPHFCVSSPGVVLRIRGLAKLPMAMTTVSTSSSNSLPCLTTGRGGGRRRPGSPSSISTQVMARTLPFSSPWIGGGVGEHAEVDALFFGVVHFLEAGGHLLFRAAIDDGNFVRAQASAERAAS